ncbi:hypothetical protein PV04_09088 [Phialophora macrospora]|uniref:Uncharacterized protein n=1 Tax=Phialophora macrospora TaxID=1851006 RepID=A0A0D2F801_9EURO|nr:hypothetical protein PV04_09088 [Phialophora macrospora]
MGCCLSKKQLSAEDMPAVRYNQYGRSQNAAHSSNRRVGFSGNVNTEPETPRNTRVTSDSTRPARRRDNGITESSMGSNQAIIGSRTSRQTYTTTNGASGSGSRAGKGPSSSWETVLCHSSQYSSR